MEYEALKSFLDRHYRLYNSVSFIPNDPISIPHRFHKKQDREIIALWIALLSWGNRKSILNSGNVLCELMDNAPYEFIFNHKEGDRKVFLKFVHRTFNGEDALYFLEFFQNYYKEYASLEEAFSKYNLQEDPHVENSLIHFRKEFIKYAKPAQRTLKHVSSPENNSRCKRLLMFLRWMVRKDDGKVDFGIWNSIKPSQLLMPLDIHVMKIARQLKMLVREQSDWKAVLELSSFCAKLDPSDPVKYDFALFGLGLSEKNKSPVTELRTIS